MPLLDISHVTEAIMRVIEEEVALSPAWLPRPPPSIVPLPPDRIETDALGLYLYHIAENSHFRNPAEPSGNGQSPIRSQPLALNLYYQLYAQSSGAEGGTHLQSQLLLGCAVKALHDFPILDDETEVGQPPVRVLDQVQLAGSGNVIRLTLQPVPHTESVSFWTAGNTHPRTAAYYEASVIFLEPDPLPARSAPVLTYGVHLFLAGAPQLTGSRNTIEFTPPGGTPTSLSLSPAVVPFGGRVALLGTNFAGDETRLELEHADWDEPRAVDDAWALYIATDRVTATVQTTIDGDSVFPGVYSAKVVVVRNRTMPDGSTRTFEDSSNLTPFSIAPRLDTVPAPDGTGLVTAEGIGFAHADLTDDRVRVVFAATEFVRVAGPAPAAGEFSTEAFAGAPDVLRLRLQASTVSGPMSLRLLVNGIEAPPTWVTVP